MRLFALSFIAALVLTSLTSFKAVSSLSADQTTVAVGTTVYFVGTGFDKGKQVMVTIPYPNNQYVDFIAGTADASGTIRFTATFNTAGVFTVQAYQNRNRSVINLSTIDIDVY